MTAFIIVWLAGSVVAFLALRRFALRDFGAVTIGGAIGLALVSLFTPAALVTILFLSLEGGLFGKVIWTRGEK